MSEQTRGSASNPLPLPDAPNLDWLRKQAKQLASRVRKANPGREARRCAIPYQKIGFAAGAPSRRTSIRCLSKAAFRRREKGDVAALLRCSTSTPKS